MKAPKVTSIVEAREKAKFEELLALPDPDKLFDIPFDDMQQYLDSANESRDDPVVLGPRALVAVKKLFAHFGIEETPLTLGELNGALHYCKFLQLQTWTLNSTPEDVELHHRVVIELAGTYYPELVESLKAYTTGDLEGLRRIAKERLTLAEMSAHYHFEFGWLCTQSRQRRDAGLPIHP